MINAIVSRQKMTINSLSKRGYTCSFLKVNGQRVPEPMLWNLILSKKLLYLQMSKAQFHVKQMWPSLGKQTLMIIHYPLEN